MIRFECYDTNAVKHVTELANANHLLFIQEELNFTFFPRHQEDIDTIEWIIWLETEPELHKDRYPSDWS